MMIENIPLPALDDPTDEAFWQSAARGVLVIQKCGSCEELRHPPRPMCPKCQSRDRAWEKVSGRGRIWSFASPSSPLLPAFEALVPYVTAVVTLDEHPSLRVVGPIVKDDQGTMQGVLPTDISIGQSVNVQFKQVSNDCFLPCWRPAST